MFQRLTQALDGVPPEVLAAEGTIAGKSIKEICCLLAAWDGESLRRLRVISGENLERPHDPQDSQYWEAWGQKQIAVKKIMSAQGTMIDLISTRQRLLAQVMDLNDLEFEGWIKADPTATRSLFARYVPQIEAWRQGWAPPPERGWRRWLKLGGR